MTRRIRTLTSSRRRYSVARWIGVAIPFAIGALLVGMCAYAKDWT